MQTPGRRRRLRLAARLRTASAPDGNASPTLTCSSSPATCSAALQGWRAAREASTWVEVAHHRSPDRGSYRPSWHLLVARSAGPSRPWALADAADLLDLCAAVYNAMQRG